MEHFADYKDARLGTEYRKALVSLPKTKTGRFQSVDIENSVVRQLLSDLVAVTKPGKRLFPGGEIQYRAAFKATCASLGLSERYVPHSLRHGGATRLHLKGVPIEDILTRGRWKSTMSARTYIKMGPALLLAMQAPKSVAVAAEVLAKDVGLAMTLTQKHK
jgi:integrase